MDDHEKLIEAAQRYYDGLPTGMTDQEYDKLFNDSGMTKEVLMSQLKVNGDTDKHRIVIPIHDKMTDWTKFDEYANREGAILTKKYDGCSIVAYYKNGHLDEILTRSNEIDGKVKTKSLEGKFPHEVDERVIAILAEALVPLNISDTRSSANGLVNSKYKQDEIDNNLYLRAFDVVTSDPMDYLDRMSLAVGMIHEVIDKDTAMYINDHGNDGKFYVDGVVIYGKDFTQIFKLESATESAVTQVIEEVLEVSEKTGLLTPKYMLEPVVINNVKVKCVGNCGSIDTIEKKGLGIGSTVEVHLAKAVIPQIKEIITEGKLPEVRVCPICGESVKRFQGKFVCTNPNCKTWTDRYDKYKDDLLQFVTPPRMESLNTKKMTDKQREYYKLTLNILNQVLYNKGLDLMSELNRIYN